MSRGNWGWVVNSQRPMRPTPAHLPDPWPSPRSRRARRRRCGRARCPCAQPSARPRSCRPLGRPRSGWPGRSRSSGKGTETACEHRAAGPLTTEVSDSQPPTPVRLPGLTNPGTPRAPGRVRRGRRRGGPHSATASAWPRALAALGPPEPSTLAGHRAGSGWRPRLPGNLAITLISRPAASAPKPLAGGTDAGQGALPAKAPGVHSE